MSDFDSIFVLIEFPSAVTQSVRRNDIVTNSANKAFEFRFAIDWKTT